MARPLRERATLIPLAADGMELCRFEGVTVAFGGVRALNPLDFAVDSDDGVTGIIGPGGAGKSTALSAMMGAVKPAQGHVHVLGHEITRRMGPEHGAEGSARGADREGATQMKINRGREKAVRSERRSETFTGTVWADRVLSDPAGAVGIGSVFFEPGARTHWHRHTAGQVLVVTHGQGRVRSRDGNGGVIAAGDVVHIAPGEEHWHGAEADSYMLHLAISLGKSEWLRAVTDEEYRQGFE